MRLDKTEVEGSNPSSWVKLRMREQVVGEIVARVQREVRRPIFRMSIYKSGGVLMGSKQPGRRSIISSGRM